MWVDDRRLIDEFTLWGKCFARLVAGDVLLSTTSCVWSKFYRDDRLRGDWGQSPSKCGGYMMIPRGSWTWEKPGKTFIRGFFEPYNFPKGWGQASNNYIQHIYSYSTLRNYPNTQHGRGNKFANDHYIIVQGMMWSQRIMRIAGWNEFWLIWHSDAKDRTTLMQLMEEACGVMQGE